MERALNVLAEFLKNLSGGRYAALELFGIFGDVAGMAAGRVSLFFTAAMFRNIVSVRVMVYGHKYFVFAESAFATHREFLFFFFHIFSSPLNKR